MADWPVPRRHGPVAGPGALSYMRVDVRACHPDRESTSHLHDHTPNRRQAARRLQPRALKMHAGFAVQRLEHSAPNGERQETARGHLSEAGWGMLTSEPGKLAITSDPLI